jgi:type I restriction enzyme, S subunit
MDYRKWGKTNLLNLSSNGLMNGAFNNPKLVGSGYKLINVVNLYSEPCIKTAELELLNLPNPEYEKYKAEKYDVFFTRSSLKLEGIAHCNIFLEDREDVIFECHIIRVRPDRNKIDPRYLHYYCISADARRHFMRCAKTTTMTTIDQEGIGSLSVLIPSLPEQHKIAEVLGTWDEAIDLLEKLITAKRKLKQGLMQQLLTGKKRFKEFEASKWMTVRLGNLPVSLIDGDRSDNYPSQEFVSQVKTETHQILFLSTSNFKNNRLDLQNAQFITKDKFNSLSKGKLIDDDLVITLRGSIGNIIRFQSKIETGFINAQMLIIRNQKFNTVLSTNFLYTLLCADIYQKSMLCLSSGSAQPQLPVKDLKRLNILLPPLPEQEKIASVLSSADEEISTLGKQLVTYKQQKRGLMQQLLTGKKRLN